MLPLIAQPNFNTKFAQVVLLFPLPLKQDDFDRSIAEYGVRYYVLPLMNVHKSTGCIDLRVIYAPE